MLIRQGNEYGFIIHIFMAKLTFMIFFRIFFFFLLLFCFHVVRLPLKNKVVNHEFTYIFFSFRFSARRLFSVLARLGKIDIETSQR